MKSLILKLSVLYTVLQQTLTATAQGMLCQGQVFPTECAFNDIFINASTWDHCQRYTEAEVPVGVEFNRYIHCSKPTQLTDSNLGSMQHIDHDTFCMRNNQAGTVLFTFSEPYTFTQIKLHFYSSSTTGLPRVTFYTVSESYMIWSHLPPSVIESVGPNTAAVGMWVATLNIANKTRKIAMHVGSSSYQFYLSEVEFFTCRVQVTPRTKSSIPSTNEGCQIPSSLPPVPATMDMESPNHNTDSLTTTILVRQTTTSENQSNNMTKSDQTELACGNKSTGHFLSWSFVGMLISVLCLWGIANIICLGVHLRRKKKYRVQQNPSYSFTSPAVYHINKEPIYDTPK